MATQPDPQARNFSRKPQLNLEVTDADKVYFEKLAEACGMKLATLVRKLLTEEAKRLGVPALLDDYLSSQLESPGQYRVPRQIDSETKLGIFRRFLQRFEADCDFSKSTFEVNRYAADVTRTAYSPSGEDTSTIVLELAPASERENNYREQRDIDAIWHEVLGLSLVLADKWNGVNYTVEARRTLRGKKLLLQRFVEEHSGARFKVNASYNGGRVFKVTAAARKGQKELLIEYLPQRGGEVAELQQALDEYQQLER